MNMNRTEFLPTLKIHTVKGYVHTNISSACTFIHSLNSSFIILRMSHLRKHGAENNYFCLTYSVALREEFVSWHLSRKRSDMNGFFLFVFFCMLCALINPLEFLINDLEFSNIFV